MANKLLTGEYECSYCKQRYVDPFKADACRSAHDLVYFQLSRVEVDRLLKFLYFRDESLLDPKTILRIKQAMNIYASD